MKPIVSLLCACPLLVCLVSPVPAQTLQAVYTFNTNGPANSQTGAYPRSGLTLAPDGYLYGTTEYGGLAGNGTIFRINTNGFFTTVHAFSPISASPYTNYDGAGPFAGLTLAGDGHLYGVASGGGSFGYGNIYQLASDGTVSNLYSFGPYPDGENPLSDLVVDSDGNLHGSTVQGGTAWGNIFEYSFNSGYGTYTIPFLPQPPQIDWPYLTAGTNNIIYGVAKYGGTNNPTSGCVFVMSGPSPVILYSFTGGNDGGNPQSPLTLGPDGNYYGTATTGGTNGYGTIYRIAPDGSNFNTLYSFTNGTDGASPQATLTVGPDGQLYGTTYSGGAYGDGTLFSISTTGTFTALASFNGTNGANPLARLTLAGDGNFYGTTFNGGNGYGVIYRLVLGLPRILNISPGANYSMNLLFSDAPGSTNRLFSTTSLSTPFAQWQYVGTGIAATNGLFQITDPNATNAATFYRFISP